MEVLKTILKIMNFISIIYMIYYAGMAMFAFSMKNKKYAKIDYKRKFAVIIPARNEELVVGNLIDS